MVGIVSLVSALTSSWDLEPPDVGTRAAITLGLALPKQKGREERENKAEGGLCLAFSNLFFVRYYSVCSSLGCNSQSYFSPPGSSLTQNISPVQIHCVGFVSTTEKKDSLHHRVQQLDTVEN